MPSPWEENRKKLQKHCEIRKSSRPSIAIPNVNLFISENLTPVNSKLVF